MVNNPFKNNQQHPQFDTYPGGDKRDWKLDLNNKFTRPTKFMRQTIFIMIEGFNDCGPIFIFERFFTDSKIHNLLKSELTMKYTEYH